MYAKLEKLVLPNLVGFKEDLTVYDKKALKNYDGAYLHAYRENGTNLILLDSNSINYSLDKEEIRSNLFDMLTFFKGANKHFHYFNGADIIELDWESLHTIYKNFVIEVMSKKDEIEKLQIDLIALDLFQLMTEFRNWKQKVKESSSDIFRRVRNRFDFFEIKKADSFYDLKEQLYKQCLLVKN
jgi:hypothetical protein